KYAEHNKHYGSKHCEDQGPLFPDTHVMNRHPSFDLGDKSTFWLYCARRIARVCTMGAGLYQNAFWHPYHHL
ncbi:MAG: hypothetical protein RSC40_09245, partial [Clostridia bacterium]